MTIEETKEEPDNSAGVLTRSGNETTHNMATTKLLEFVKKPKTFEIGDDVEDAIKDFNKYFELTNVIDEYKILFVQAFLSDKAHDLYKKTSSQGSWEEKMRACFTRETSLAEDLSKLMNYRKGTDKVADFFSTIQKLTKKVLEHKLDEASLTSYFIQHSLDDKEMKKEIFSKNLKSTEEMEKELKRLEEYREKFEGEPAISYADAVNKEQNIIKKIQRPTQQHWRNPVPHKQENRESYPNQQVSTRWYNPTPQHTPRQQHFTYRRADFPRYTQKRQIGQNNQTQFERPRENNEKKCFACNQWGHIRKECPNVKCDHCHMKGHFKFQCHDLHPERKFFYNQKRAYTLESQMNYEEAQCNEDLNESAPALESTVGAISKS